MTPNLRGAALMTLSMLGFAIEDALIKGLSGRVPPGQIIAVIGLGGAVILALWIARRGARLLLPEFVRPQIIARSGCEVMGTMFFVSAIALVPLTLASAIIQATPLVVALGAALFLGQTVGWRRWTAIAVGFAGVVLILRPWQAGFDPYLLLAVGGMLFLASRDLITRALSVPVSGPHLSLHAFVALVPAGLLLMAVWGDSPVWPTPREWLLLGGCIGIGMVAYLSIVAATRAGDAAIISSFRYSRMIFALGIGWAIFGERPDATTFVGIAIVIGAGLFTLIREARLHRSSKARPQPI